MCLNKSPIDGLISIGMPPPVAVLTSNFPTRSPSRFDAEANSRHRVVLATCPGLSSATSGGHNAFFRAMAPPGLAFGRRRIRRIEFESVLLQKIAALAQRQHQGGITRCLKIRKTYLFPNCTCTQSTFGPSGSNPFNFASPTLIGPLRNLARTDRPPPT